MAKREQAQLQVEVPEAADLGAVLLRLCAHASAVEEARAEQGAERPVADFPGSFQRAGDLVLLVGSIQGDARGSAYLEVEHGLHAGAAPAVDPAREAAVDEVVRRALEEGLLSSVRRCGVGGLGVALARACLAEGPGGEGAGSGLGAALRVPFPARKDLVLFSEERARAVVSLPASSVARLDALAREVGAPVVPLGAVGGDRLEIQAAASVPVDLLARAWRRELPGAPDAEHDGEPGEGEPGPLPAARA